MSSVSPDTEIKTIQEVSQVVNGIGFHLQQLNLFLSFFSIFINIFHLLILSRKHMKATSTNIILIGISISDILIMLSTVYKNYGMVDRENSDCMTTDFRFKIYMDIFVWGINTSFRRCGCWLGVLMATVRYLIVKKVTVSRYGNWSQASVGWIMILVVFVVSGLQTTFYQSRWIVVENRFVPLPLM
ncbi:Protein CBG17824 [Caenorhabditis briggsae]|uniref:Protein CBG17824 n=1 Tax=Caenorhabditis briggsae TaxID=6238 RepID=E3CU66_CAEBR|nr:Protein CBG17824 [Caenorhabditis briggsae]CBX33064.1 Protein CBG17824 [Caenorhabditis briggsae]